MKNQFIRKHVFFLLALLSLFTSELYAEDSLKINPGRVQALESRLIAGLLSQYHIRKTELNDSLSSVIFDDYIQSLDNNKLYFYQADLDTFEKHRYRLDDHIQLGYLTSVYDIFNLFKERFNERIDYTLNEMSFDFDWEADEYFESDVDKRSFATNDDERNEAWEHMIKYQSIALKLTGLEDSLIEERIKSRYERIQKNINEYRSDDVFQLFMNCMAEAFDPHTNYFSPITSDNFRINMSQSLEGIGATLTSENEYIKVVSIVTGGPAFESKELMENDRIIAVAQGDKGDFVEVIGWRVDDAVQLIRGKKGSVVRLQVLKAGESISAKPIEVRLVRDKIRLEVARAKSEILPVKRNGKDYHIGIITIPSFYMDFDALRKGDPDYSSTTRDVKKILDELKQDKVDGIMVDLRFNGGGSLQEAIELTGLFIDKGPVVQVKNADGSIDVGEDKESGYYFDGPLTVLTNRFSASASEIFAGAIKDYNRGVVVGETTFGKGTVQNLIELNQFVPNEKEKLGQVKLTLAKYYRVNGYSTQHKGVEPDIKLPSIYPAEEYGESAKASSLPWDQIRSSKYKATTYVTEDLRKKLQSEFEQRLENESYLTNLIQEVEEIKKLRSKSQISLNLAKRKAEEERNLDYSKINSDMSLETNISREDITFSDDMSEDKIKDVYLREGVVILTEIIKYKIG